MDYIDSPYEKYEPPSARVVASKDRRWLVKRGFGGGGTGVYLATEEWFEMRCGAFHRTLSAPSSGHDANARPARYFSTRFKEFRKAQGRESLEFAYVVLFQDYENQRQLWQEEHTVVFSRTDENTSFTFDHAASNLTAKLEEKIFAFDSFDRSDFVEFAYDRLLPIARDHTDRRHDWLRGFLSDSPDTPKVKVLKSALAAQERRPKDSSPKR